MSRITGLATGLDVDAVIEETMQAERTKIDAVGQQKALVELQQELYREVITEFRNFYDDYFDISKSNSILLQKNWASVGFESSNSSVVTATASGGAQVDNYDVQVVQLAEPAKHTVSDADLENLSEITITVKIKEKDADGKEVEKDKPITIKFENEKSSSEKATLINSSLKEYGMSAKYSSFSKGIVISTTSNGADQKFGIKYGEVNIPIDEQTTEEGKVASQLIRGKDCVAQITNSQKESYYYSGSSNTVTLDSVTFKFTDINATGNPQYKNGEIIGIDNLIETSSAKITGKTDATAVKDSIVKFVEDYNKIMTKLNTLINEKRDSDYMPLTDEQREAMTEKQIELWEAKVKTGLLSRDSDLVRIRNAMKNAMSSVISSSGLSLEKIGITPSSDYSGNKNGTYTIDEDKLLSALEDNSEDVMKLFVNSGDSSKGILNQLKSTLDKETQSSSGALLKKAGMEGTATASNNTLSKKIKAYETKISRMEKLFSTKQQALYSKYATLETLMNNLNSQMNYLSSMFSS